MYQLIAYCVNGFGILSRFFLYEKIGTPPVIVIQVIDKISNEIDVFSNAIGFWI